MKKRQQISLDDAKRIGESLQIDWDQVDIEQFRQGLIGDPKPGTMDPEKRIPYDYVLLTGKVVLTHMREFPDYFSRLAKLGAEVNEYRARRR